MRFAERPIIRLGSVAGGEIGTDATPTPILYLSKEPIRVPKFSPEEEAAIVRDAVRISTGGSKIKAGR